MLDKRYNPNEVENRLYPQWEESGLFTPSLNNQKPTYTVMMPPPNVTGHLHIGHALNHTLQDIMVRYYRMQGYDVLWQPGTDHAGIATQSVVERQMDQEGVTRHDLGREKFLERAWKWKESSGGMIVHQLRRLGISPDWTRERFTMDEGLNAAVRQVFVELYNQGLIFRDKRLVNWDPKLHTAISDLEVKNKDSNGHMWHFQYPLENAEGHIAIATTRPETMLGDTAVAVHPLDKRYQHLIGKNVILPLVNRKIPIIADDYSDPEKGSGAVKITPAHDFNDFEVGRRHNLESINIFDPSARLNDKVPERFQNLDRFEARKRIIAEMTELDLLLKVEEIHHTIPTSERSGVTIEPWLTDQWFIDAKVLAEPALDAVRKRKTQFVPENWTKTYFNWLEDIQPWCISRQLWWGHQIPAWFGPDNHIFVAQTEEEALAQAKEHYGQETPLTQDEDVLDTWFSSALWPFSTIGWPEKTKELKSCYPGNLLITGHDIIFFWVARMIMMGLHFMKDVPFRTVYITALVRDEHGQKMSKSKGNVIDPLEFLDNYGADALRFSLSSLAGPGRSVNFSKSQIEGYRNFTTKLWNAFRFCEQNQCFFDPSFDPNSCVDPLNQWMIGEIHKLGQTVAEHLSSYRFDEASLSLYHFIWGTFCDWYIELIKPILQAENKNQDLHLIQETRQSAMWGFVQIIHLLHPFMPFITEELWQHLTKGQEGFLMASKWPSYALTNAAENTAAQDSAKDEIEWTIELISQIRAARAELRIAPGERLVLYAGRDFTKCLQRQRSTIERLARLSEIKTTEPISQSAMVQVLVQDHIFHLDVDKVVDIEAERCRLESSLANIELDLKKLDKKLAQEDFLRKAPPSIIEKNKDRRSESIAKREKIIQALSRIEKVN